MNDPINAEKLHARIDLDTGLCTMPCFMIVCPTGNPEAPIRYHGFGGDGTATTYTEHTRAEQVLRTLNPAQGWIIQRVMVVSRVSVIHEAADKDTP
jgi:hypothetical protein